MGMIFRGIKKRLFFHFWILFFLSMTIVDILVLYIFLDISISQKIDWKMDALIATCEEKGSVSIKEDETTARRLENSFFGQGTRFSFITAPYAFPSSNAINGMNSDLELLVSETLKDGKSIIKKENIIFGFFFIQYETAIITHPLKRKGKTIAAGGIEFPLTQEYQAYNRIQKFVMGFILIVSFFFAMIGNQQLLRLYYKPLQRLSRLAETFQDEENAFFCVRREDNIFSSLSSSLNTMLNRIAEDKKALNDTIGSLTKANKELVKAQNDVIRAEKMTTIGRLTSGIAHEIGNPIGIVLGYLDLMRNTELREIERKDFIDRSEQEITRINNIIRQLLDMSRSYTHETEPVSVHELLDDLVSVFTYQPTADHINFQIASDSSEDKVLADPDQLRQVFLNLLLNSVDEVNEHCGNEAWIKISTHLKTVPEDDSRQMVKKMIKVSIEDNGRGIDTCHLPHLFEPFYTTKQPGKGTGLGLSVSFMIVERLGGKMAVEPQPGKGAVFHVTLPVV